MVAIYESSFIRSVIQTVKVLVFQILQVHLLYHSEEIFAGAGPIKVAECLSEVVVFAGERLLLAHL
jgi:hypothetical protein